MLLRNRRGIGRHNGGGNLCMYVRFWTDDFSYSALADEEAAIQHRGGIAAKRQALDIM
jgi:hypothetical protein